MYHFPPTQPHEDHFGHVLASHDREHAEDHHFEPVNYRRDIIRTKHARRKNRKRRQRQLQQLMHTTSTNSIDSGRTEADAVPDVPIPVAEGAEDDISIKEADAMFIPMENLEPGRATITDELRDDDGYDQQDQPLSPKVIIESKHTEV